MNVENERSRSLWMQAERPKARPLSSDLKVETLVVGAGIAGLSTAYELVLRGQEVAVVDRGSVAGGMTARTSAHLSCQIDDRYAKLIDAHGEGVMKRRPLRCVHVVHVRRDKLDLLAFGQVGGLVQDEASVPHAGPQRLLHRL